jgi:hypothetical protein
MLGFVDKHHFPFCLDGAVDLEWGGLNVTLPSLSNAAAERHRPGARTWHGAPVSAKRACRGTRRMSPSIVGSWGL